MKIHTLGGKMVDARRIKRLLGHYLRDYRNGKHSMENWKGRRSPTNTWRKAMSQMARQKNHQHRVNRDRERFHALRREVGR